ncbi:MAG: DUF2238 domain-containing protein [Acidobacteriota bacterium]
MSYSHERRLLLILVVVSFVLLGLHPKADRLTWFLENAPVLMGLAALFATDSRFQFSRLAYRLMALHALILMVGGHWSYAEVPIGDWVGTALHLQRNHYDRLGHLAQGFIPAILTREILFRKSPLKPGKWLFFVVTCICLALSAFYELIEWWVALASGEGATAFLGTQGDPWDTQWDMFLALAGALTAQWLLSRIHDRSMEEPGRHRATTPPA